VQLPFAAGLNGRELPQLPKAERTARRSERDLRNRNVPSETGDDFRSEISPGARHGRRSPHPLPDCRRTARQDVDAMNDDEMRRGHAVAGWPAFRIRNRS